MFRKLEIIFLLFLLSGGLLSCAMVKTEGATSASGQKSSASYYDFADILIPSELTIDKKALVRLQHFPIKSGHPYIQRASGIRFLSRFLSQQYAEGWVASDLHP